MRTARFWTRAEESVGDISVTARGWSETSIEAAREKAREIAHRVAERVAGGFAKGPRYPYGDRPLPEPILREFSGGAVTRNVYGAMILNTDLLMFVDIDRKHASAPAPSAGGLFSSLFAKPAKPATPPGPDPAIAAIRGVAERHNLSARLYETAAGYRLMVTSAPYQAGTPETEGLLTEFQADRLYIHLCRMQQSFRARLTPKPFRIDFANPPGDFPFETPQAQAEHDRWVAEYNTKSAPFATCRFVESIGNGAVADGFPELIAYHDQETKSETGLRLA